MKKMESKKGYRVLPFSLNRRMVAASAAVCREHNTIHTITEADVTIPRRLIREHYERTGERLSLTAYVVACLGRTVAEFPEFNAIRTRGKLLVLDNVTIGTLIEREFDDGSVPEPVSISSANKLGLREIHDRIRAAAEHTGESLGALSGATWVTRLIPSVFFKTFVQIASRSVLMAKRYGVISVTAVGMFGPSPMWLVPLSASTVTVAVGGIIRRTVSVSGDMTELEFLCLTISFDHDIIDGAPAARFTKRLTELISQGEIILDEIDRGR